MVWGYSGGAYLGYTGESQKENWGKVFLCENGLVFLIDELLFVHFIWTSWGHAPMALLMLTMYDLLKYINNIYNNVRLKSNLFYLIFLSYKITSHLILGNKVPEKNESLQLIRDLIYHICLGFFKIRSFDQSHLKCNTSKCYCLILKPPR